MSCLAVGTCVLKGWLKPLRNSFLEDWALLCGFERTDVWLPVRLGKLRDACRGCVGLGSLAPGQGSGVLGSSLASLCVCVLTCKQAAVVHTSRGSLVSALHAHVHSHMREAGDCVHSRGHCSDMRAIPQTGLLTPEHRQEILTIALFLSSRFFFFFWS